MGMEGVVVIVVDNIGDGDGRGCRHPFETTLGMGVVIIIVVGRRWMGVMVVSCCLLEMVWGGRHRRCWMTLGWGGHCPLSVRDDWVGVVVIGRRWS